jgi:hypothetical protein
MADSKEDDCPYPVTEVNNKAIINKAGKIDLVFIIDIRGDKNRN